MSNYIEFSTDRSNRFLRASLGNPVHDGKVPNASVEVQGIRVDGRPVEFMDETIPARVHQILYTKKRRIKGRRQTFDCLEFAEHMFEMRFPTDINPLDTVDPDPLPDEALIDPTIARPLHLFQVWNRMGIYDHQHTVVPAHTVSEAQYIHKLGHEGPLCLSSLARAMDMYGCRYAHAVMM